VAALIGCIHTNAQLDFEISDVLSRSENKTDGVYLGCVSPAKSRYDTALNFTSEEFRKIAVY